MRCAVPVGVIPILALAWAGEFTIVGHHECFETGNYRCHYAVADLELRAGDCVGGDEEDVARVDFDVQIIEAETDYCYYSEKERIY